MCKNRVFLSYLLVPHLQIFKNYRIDIDFRNSAHPNISIKIEDLLEIFIKNFLGTNRKGFRNLKKIEGLLHFLKDFLTPELLHLPNENYHEPLKNEWS